jgi:outer membrane protein insertion porin family
VNLDVNIDKKEKIHVHKITFEGNKVIKAKKLKRVMKKTNERHKLLNIFRPKKFINSRLRGR